MVLQFVWSVVFWTFGTIHAIYKSSRFLLLAILALRNARVHVCASNSCDITTDVEVPINECFSIQAILKISNINPNNCYV